MAYSKVILNGTTLIDLTQKTVTAANMLNGITALKNDGTDITGTYVPASTQSKTATPSTSQQTISPDPGFLLSSVTVNAMPSGTAGTPSAVKSSVANHSVTVTPSVTNTTGYITGGTLTGTPASVSASELVSGTLSITDNGTGIDVTNYASVDVDVSGGGGSATTVSFDSNCIFSGTYISYIDGNGDYQHTTTLAAMSAVSYQMLSKSLLAYANRFDPAMSGDITGTPVGMTLVDTKTISITGNAVYLRFYQVD